MKKTIVYGDMHSDFDSLRHIREMEGIKMPGIKTDSQSFLELLDEFGSANRNFNRTICLTELPKELGLGDYTDRDAYPVEVISTLVYDYLEDPENVVLLKGNHDEGRWNQTARDLEVDFSPFDLRDQIISIYGKRDGKEVLQSISEKFWSRLPYSLLVEGKYWFVHGGVPVGNNERGTYMLRGNVENPCKDEMHEMIWNDPIPGETNTRNYRGNGIRSFGYLASDEIMESLCVKAIIRSHEPDKIIKSEHGGRVLTVGSCPNAYSSMEKGAYLVLNGNENPMNADELMKKCGRIFSKY